MARALKPVLLALAAALTVALAWRTLKQKHGPPASAKPAAQATASIGALQGTGIRADGYYICERGNLRYLMRFFPEGNVVTINGMKDMEAELPKFLTPSTKGNPAMGLHNSAYTVQGDSVRFVTRPERGEISYRGKAESPELLRMHRHSHITGVDYDMDYRFRPDASSQDR
jgi:hypothetical protein